MKFLFLLALLGLPAFATDLVIDDSWELTFEDNFDSKKLKRKFWSKSLLWESGLGSSIFKDSQVWQENGHLVLETINKSAKDPKGKEFPFTSGLVHSFGKFAQRYGLFVIRMKLPTEKGLWPAFWLMPDRLGGKGGTYQWWEDGRRSTSVVNFRGEVGKGMEIDIMEHLTVWGPNKFHQAFHWDGYGENHKSDGNTIRVPDSVDGYREFALLWQPNNLTWFIDGVEVFHYESERVADVPMYLKINTATGGWDGNTVSNPGNLPAQTLVDWVRVYKNTSRY